MDLRATDTATELLHPGDEGYDAAAGVMCGHGAPALVARPRNPEEVAAALEHAVRHDLEVSVRSGGHSLLGHSTNSGGIVVDLGHLDTVEVLDEARRLVRIGGGATWGAVAAALAPHGWVVTSGDTASVGVGGLTLGGGIGWLVRKHGLAIDQLVGARVVTADGRLVPASATENEALFWALRGGGGNFGVVVDLDFVAQPARTVRFGSIDYCTDDIAGLLARWRDAMRAAPDEVSSTLVVPPTAPGLQSTATVLVCHAPDPDNGDDDPVFPLLDLGPVADWSISERAYADILEPAPPHPPGIRPHVRNTLVRALDDRVIAAIDRFRAGPAPTMVAVRSLGGAVARVPADATAFAHRDAEAMVVGAVVLPMAAPAEQVDRALAPWDAVAAHGVGAYVGFQGADGPDDVAAVYPRATRLRLATVKRAYDPDNLFRSNHNIAPLGR
ncbi:hypothetical protein DJ010_21370 [Nocardioides silvaticus]|uniref:FAD-binding PCMH-type domain-containing protein n=1 Tax=Nocardioides silvaticus TaxID=2201891 RepID=A0A316TCY2_9ACTN|nr:FAD-binding oxidoreductase [Nocardioides silvaticus]PWN00879.1 hypothetical protein DJ010_21370 [Nocardioides silvaticus]